MSCDVGANVIECIDDEFEGVRGFFDGNVGVGVERKFEDFGEYVWESSELLLTAVNGGGSGGEVVVECDVSVRWRWMNFHGCLRFRKRKVKP